MLILKESFSIIIAGFLILLAQTLPAQTNNCFDCHAEWEDTPDAPTQLIQKDIHFNAGLGCEDCHGGNPALEDMDDVRRSKDYKGIPSPVDIPRFCASCHSDPGYMIRYNPALPTDQYDKYKISVHGKRLLLQNDTMVANCVSCHSVHDIASSQVPASDVYAMNLPKTCAKCHSNQDYMAAYMIPTDQYDDYTKSVHGQALLVKKDINAPACNDCHGNHGATPPGVTSISAVCGICHALIADQFSQSPHKKAFDDRGYPECEICHSNHLVLKPEYYMIGTSDSSLCVDCHLPGDGTRGLATAEIINTSLTELFRAYSHARDKIDEADLKGLLVTDMNFTLQELKQTIIQTQTVVHSFDADKVTEIAQPGINKAETLKQSALAKIDEYDFRRKGLGLATIIITILAISLYLKIRAIEK